MNLTPKQLKILQLIRDYRVRRGYSPTMQELDLTNEAAVTAYYAGLPELWAPVHLAVGFAGAPITETSLADVAKQHDMNFITAFLCCREAVRKNAKRIVNVVSKAALEPTGGTLAYSTSKAALVALTRGLAEEVKGKGIWVNAVAPSIMDTPANRKAMPKADFEKWPKTGDVAKAILWLASEENALTTGSIVPVYGAT